MKISKLPIEQSRQVPKNIKFMLYCISQNLSKTDVSALSTQKHDIISSM